MGRCERLISFLISFSPTPWCVCPSFEGSARNKPRGPRIKIRFSVIISPPCTFPVFFIGRERQKQASAETPTTTAAVVVVVEVIQRARTRLYKSAIDFGCAACDPLVVRREQGIVAGAINLLLLLYVVVVEIILPVCGVFIPNFSCSDAVCFLLCCLAVQQRMAA